MSFFDFPKAWELLNLGYQVRRSLWNGGAHPVAWLRMSPAPGPVFYRQTGEVERVAKNTDVTVLDANAKDWTIQAVVESDPGFVSTPPSERDPNLNLPAYPRPVDGGSGSGGSGSGGSGSGGGGSGGSGSGGSGSGGSGSGGSGSGGSGSGGSGSGGSGSGGSGSGGAQCAAGWYWDASLNRCVKEPEAGASLSIDVVRYSDACIPRISGDEPNPGPVVDSFMIQVTLSNYDRAKPGELWMIRASVGAPNGKQVIINGTVVPGGNKTATVSIDNTRERRGASYPVQAYAYRSGIAEVITANSTVQLRSDCDPEPPDPYGPYGP